MIQRLAPPAVVVATVLAASPGAAQSGRADLVPRATAYVTGFFERFTNLVAEERYVQETASPRRRREIRSDFLRMVISPHAGACGSKSRPAAW